MPKPSTTFSSDKLSNKPLLVGYTASASKKRLARPFYRILPCEILLCPTVEDSKLAGPLKRYKNYYA
jgi:hypothetical protein